MKWIYSYIIFSFLLMPIVGNATAIHHHATVTTQQVEDSKPPKKNLRKWIKNHPGILIYGGLAIAGTLMIAFGILRGIRWLWMLGLFTIIAPWILAIIIIIFAIIFGKRRPRPIPINPEIEKTKPKKEKK